MDKFKKYLKYLILIGIVVIVSIFTYVFYEEQVTYIFNHPRELASYGFLGYCLMVLAVMVQIIIAFLPGEMVEVIAGIVYGPFLGLLLCMIGTVLGTGVVYYMVKRWGVGLVERFFDRHQIDQIKVIEHERRLFPIFFIIFLIPGTPKDLITYMMPLMPLNFKQVILITLVGKIPSIVTSTYAGEYLVQKNYMSVLVIYLFTGIVALGGYYLYNYFTRKK